MASKFISFPLCTKKSSFEDFIKHQIRNDLVELDFNGHHGFELGTVKPSETPWAKEMLTLYSSGLEWESSGIYRIFEPSFTFRLGMSVAWNIDESDLVAMIMEDPDDKHNELAQLKEAFDYFKKWKAGELTDPLILSKRESRCSQCGAPLDITYDGKTLAVVDQCEHVGGIRDYTAQLDVPSGKLIFGNDFRQHMNGSADGDIEFEIGMKQVVSEYAELGMFHFFVGNSCPMVASTGVPNELVIGHDGYDYDTDDVLDPLGTEEHGNVTTDLWWVSAMDKDLFEQRSREKDITYEYDTFVVDVDPGTYEITVHGRGQEVAGVAYKYATIRKVP